MNNDFENPYFNLNNKPAPNADVNSDFFKEPETGAFHTPQPQAFKSEEELTTDTAVEVNSEPQSVEPVGEFFTKPAEEALPSAQQPSSNSSYEWFGKEGSPKSNPVSAPYSAPVSSQPKHRKKKEKKTVSVGVFVAGMAICLCLSTFISFVALLGYGIFSKSNLTTTDSGLTINKVESEQGDYTDVSGGLSTVEIVEKTADSVVEITTETVQTGVFAQQYIQSGAGSGVIVDKEGYIVTNHHVINGASKVSVTLRDGTSYSAKLVGTDAQMDLALIKVEADKALTPAVFGDSDTLKVGQRTVAIGNPLGQLGGSVTEGIISALNRDVVIDDQTMSLLQTDTAINPGNSGGGLFDGNGNLIGIVNAKSSGSEVEGLGFAIPVNDVIDVMGDLSEYGYVRGRIDLGVTFIDVDSEQMAWMYGLGEVGCYVYSVDADSNASKAGLLSGDRVVSVNSQKISTSEEIENILKTCKVGEEITLKLETSTGKSKTATFELQEYVPSLSDREQIFEEDNNQDAQGGDWWSEFFY